MDFYCSLPLASAFFLKHDFFLYQNLHRVFAFTFFGNNLPAEAAFRVLSFRSFVLSMVKLPPLRTKASMNIGNPL